MIPPTTPLLNGWTIPLKSSALAVRFRYGHECKKSMKYESILQYLLTTKIEMKNFFSALCSHLDGSIKSLMYKIYNDDSRFAEKLGFCHLSCHGQLRYRLTGTDTVKKVSRVLEPIDSILK
jgi:hypothetical protein